MLYSLSHGNGERGATASTRRNTVLCLAVVTLSTLGFVALSEFVKTLLFPSTLWELHLIKIAASSILPAKLLATRRNRRHTHE